MASREKEVVKTGIINVAVNLALAAIKIVVGEFTHSIAITLDGINSLADGFSSMLTIAGTKLAQRSPDHSHPFGYGRFEYLTSFVVAAIIIAAGASSFSSSVHAIREGAASVYTMESLVIVGVASVAKMALGIYTRRIGRRLESSSLAANGTDSIMDAYVSASTLVAAILNVMFGIGIESFLAAGISILIVKSGIGILFETVSKILGERQDPELTAEVERLARSVEGVKLVSGIVLMDFGPNNYNGSLHVTVNEDMTISEFDVIARKVYQRVLDGCGIKIGSVGVYPAKESTPQSRALRAKVSRLLWSHEHVVEVRGLYLDEEQKRCHFDAVVDYSVKDVPEFERELCLACQEALPDFKFEPRVRNDVGD